MKIGLIQQQNVADVKQNMQHLATKIRQLAQQGAELIVLQELHNSLYFCQVESVDNFDLAEPIPGPSTDFFGHLAKELGVVIVTSLFERRAPGLYHNTAVVLEKDGSIAGKYRKMHIPDDPAYYEKFYFADLLIYPTAIGYESSDTPDEQERQRMAWQTVQRGHAVANGLPVVTVNRVGLEPDPSQQTNGIQFWGTSFVAGPQGELLFEAPKDQEVVTVVDVDMQRSEQVRRWWPFLRDRRIDNYGDITRRFIDK